MAGGAAFRPLVSTHLLLPTPYPSGRPSTVASIRASAASDWNGGYGGRSSFTPSDWSGVAPSAYADPRVAPVGPQQRQPAQQHPDGSMDGNPSTSYDRGEGVQDPDPLSEIARAAIDAVTGCLAFIVGGLSDAALSMLPAHVKRRAVENSVKGVLALVGLALLQSVLSLVLTVGTVALAVYAAHQVFGMQLPFLPGGRGGGMGHEGPSMGGSDQSDPRNGAYGAYNSYGAYGSGGYSGTYQQQQYQQPAGRQQYGGRGQPYPPRAGPGGPGGMGQRRQGPTIDVYYE